MTLNLDVFLHALRLCLASGMFAFGIADYASEVMRYPCKFVKSVGINIYACG